MEIQRKLILGGNAYKPSEDEEFKLGEVLSKRTYEGHSWYEYIEEIVEGDEITFVAGTWEQLIENIQTRDGPYDKIMEKFLEPIIGQEREEREEKRAAEVAEQEKIRAEEKWLKESEVRRVGKGEFIHYTPLTGGCMAITAFFRNGGGAGVHLALDEDQVRPWLDFRWIVGREELSKVEIDWDADQSGEGWYVKFKDKSTPDIAETPRSKSWLEEKYYIKELEGKTKEIQQQFLDQKGWKYLNMDIFNWFKARFNCAPDIQERTHPGYKNF